ncbi:prolipoprotein diacylglyceryl transferase [bacterium]|nr:MAG: prolipoprotein diacylglyceryl transferase [bacterium]
MHPLFSLGPLHFEAYGFFIVTGAALGVAWLMRWRETLRLPEDTWADFWKLVYVLILGGVVGGKVGFIVVEWEFVTGTPGAFWSWQTGWVYWFGAAGTMLAGKLYQEYMNRKVLPRPRAYLPIADYCAAAGALGHAVGRLGCFFAGCCHGRPTGAPWAVTFTSPMADMDPALLGVPLHPTQLYEAAGEMLLALVVINLVLPAVRARKVRQGTGFFLSMGGYSLLRFTVEFFRGDDRGRLLPGLSPSQWVSAAAFLLVAAAVAKRGLTVKDRSLEGPYLDGNV